MLTPLSWLKEFADIPDRLSPEDIAAGFVKVGFEVEAIRLPAAKIKGPLIIARVESIEELTGHKKPIRFVVVDCGQGQERGIICGARNFAEGDLVVVALPGAILPGDFVISARETYGRISDGMICSSKELGLADDHSGIIVMPKGSAQPGDDAITALAIDDPIFDIAVNPDRGYALSIRGLAREIAASLRVEFQDPVERIARLKFKPEATKECVPVKILAGASVIHLHTLDAINVESSVPLWMRRRLEKCGMRSISAPVDITNYVMLELGQPLHAFDREKIAGTLTVREGTGKESLETLDGQERPITSTNLVIADDVKVLALAGTMGGASSEVSGRTRSIALEAAHFDPISIAKNSREHRLSTEASRRFERFVDPHLAEIASKRGVELFQEIVGARYLGSAVVEPTQGKISPAKSLQVSLSGINSLIGATYSQEEVLEALRAFGIGVEVKGDALSITPPSWRHDLQHRSDIAEEIARFHSYDRIPLRLAFAKGVEGPATALSLRQRRRRAIAAFLAARGLAETQNYPFTRQDFIDSLGFVGDRARTFKLANPLSEEFPVLRTHILQSLLPTAVRNLNRGNEYVAIFEMGSIFRAKSEAVTTSILSTGKRPTDKEITSLIESVPEQPWMVAGIICGKREKSGWWGTGREAQWSDALSLAQEIVEICGAASTTVASTLAPWHDGRCAEIRVGAKPVAHAGELHPRVIELLGLPARSIAFAVLIDAIPQADVFRPTPLSTMPPVIQDVALWVEGAVDSESVKEALRQGAGSLLESIELFDRYQREGEAKVSLAFTMRFRAADRTLTAEEVSALREAAIARAAEQTGAKLRS